MQKITALLAAVFFLIIPVYVHAQDEGLEEGEAKVEEKKLFETTGDIKIGVQSIDEKDGESAKFNEYRDIENGFYLYKFGAEGMDNSNGRYIEFKGTNVGRDDQNLKFRVGGSGKWGVEVEWDEILHNMSEKAQTPYDYQGNGVYTVPATAGVDMTTAGASITTKDPVVSTYLNTYLHATDLDTKREKGRVALTYTPISSLKLKLQYSDEKKEGEQITGAPIGDRPPRSMVVQLPEPVDYQTKDLKIEAEYNGKNFQAVASHLVSDFTNNVDSLTWQSMFYNPTVADYTTVEDGATDRTFSTYGRMTLAPDNRYQSTSLAIGVNLPLDSRLTATASKGKMEQDETLLPYSYSALTTDWNDTARLPRTTADAEINTTQYNVEYSIDPINNLNLHAFYRYYDLDNETRTDEWYYVTSDSASNTAGGTGVTNQRKNLAYGYTKKNHGIDLSYNILRSTLGLGYEKEDIDRDFREADTDEDIYKVSLNTRPTNWLKVKLKYLQGDRNEGTYNGEVTDESYHFSNAPASGNDQPVAAFGNHPDLRKYDVSDRERKQYDARAILNPMNELNLALSYSQREDDYDSDVTSTQPLAGVSAANAAAQAGITAGDQLGLLKAERKTYTVDAGYAPLERLSFTAFATREESESEQRGMAFDENNRITATFDWYNAAKQWTAKTKDKTDTLGAGLGFVIIPKKLNFATDYTYSYGTVDIDYDGYGSDQPISTTYYAFNDPEKVKHKQTTVNATVEYQATKKVVVGLGYMYDKYVISDWMQEPNGGWVEEVGSEYMLRDSSQDNRWGNRLVSMGSNLSPGYENHVGMVTLAYKW